MAKQSRQSRVDFGKVEPTKGSFSKTGEPGFKFFDGEGGRIEVSRQAPPADYLAGAAKQLSDFIRNARDWLLKRDL